MTDHVKAAKGMVAQLMQSSRGQWKGPKIPIKDIENAVNSTDGLKVASLQQEGHKAGGAEMTRNLVSAAHLCANVIAHVSGGTLADIVMEQVANWQWERERGRKLSESSQKCGSTIESVLDDFEQRLADPEAAANFLVNSVCAWLDKTDPEKNPDAFQQTVQLGASNIDSFSQLLMNLCAERDKAIRCCYDKLLDDGRDDRAQTSTGGPNTSAALVPQASAVSSSAASASAGMAGAVQSSAAQPSNNVPMHEDHAVAQPIVQPATTARTEQPTPQRHAPCVEPVRRENVPSQSPSPGMRVAQSQVLPQNTARMTTPLPPNYQQSVPQQGYGDACTPSPLLDASNLMSSTIGGGYGSGQPLFDVEHIIRNAVGPVLVTLVTAGVREIVNQVEHHLAQFLEQAGAGSADMHNMNLDVSAQHDIPNHVVENHHGETHHPESPQPQESHVESRTQGMAPPVQSPQEHHAPPPAPQPVKPPPEPVPHVAGPAPAPASHPQPAPPPQHQAPVQQAPAPQPQPAPQPPVCVPAPGGSGDAPVGGASTSSNRGRARKAGAW
ncbi:hypothetical protein [Corynebacterium durum]|uniref:hypothetical protein n=1 Tax=Corynebacterium durum TaxID=61592 RepID=UPI0028EA7901|nr:hypothetical protein [Corynebacterium durum]